MIHVDQSLNLSHKRASQPTTAAAEKRVAYYLRGSTEEQTLNPEGSLKNQEDRLNKMLAAKNAAAPFGRMVGVYCDPARSGKNMKRPELRRLL